MQFKVDTVNGERNTGAPYATRKNRGDNTTEKEEVNAALNAKLLTRRGGNRFGMTGFFLFITS